MCYADIEKTNLAWKPMALFSAASLWLSKKRSANDYVWSENSVWWTFIHNWPKTIEPRIMQLVEGNYRFSPLKVFHFPDESVTLWNCEDRMVLSLLYKTIKPTLKHILSPRCFSGTRGIQGVKDALIATIEAFLNRPFRYIIRLDIKSYYASVVHKILLAQLACFYKDPRLLKYFHDVITVAVDNDGVFWSSKSRQLIKETPIVFLKLQGCDIA